jgi:hypothetical protein
METLVALSGTKVAKRVASAMLSLSWIAKASMKYIGTTQATKRKWISIKSIIGSTIETKERKFCHEEKRNEVDLNEAVRKRSGSFIRIDSEILQELAC